MGHFAGRTRTAGGIDVEQHESMAGVFWAVVALLVAAMSLTGSPGAPVFSLGGTLFVAGYLAANLAYAARIGFGPTRSDRERLVSACIVTAMLGFQQWLVGDTPLLETVAPLGILGAVSVLERPARLVFLPVVMATAVSPLVYEPIGVRLVLAHVVLLIIFVLEIGLLSDYGDRVRSQRRRLAEAKHEASERAVTDELTGLANRRALVERMAGPASEQPQTVFYFDLDGFKPYNDRFGHAAGDALLRRLGQSLGAAVGSDGEAYRVGGDEFCAIVDGREGSDGAWSTALVGALTEKGLGYAVTCSHGVATMTYDAVDLVGCLQVADQRMYVVKNVRRAAGTRHGDPMPEPG